MIGQAVRAAEAHDAFISYSRKDRAFAHKLEAVLEKFTPPRQLSPRNKRLDVFRDEKDFTGVEYHKSVAQHLHFSGKLIVVCSPAARSSPFVDEEIRRFAEDHDTSDIIPVLWAGFPNNEARNESDKAFPEALWELLDMPLAVDYRGVDLRHSKLDRGSLSNAWYTLLANLFNVSRAEIERREERRRRRRRASVATGIVAFNVIVLSLAGIALWQRQLASERLLDVNRNLALVFEEKAQASLEQVFETQSPKAAEHVWLYSLSALMLPKRANDSVAISVGRLALPEVRNLAFSELWSAQVVSEDFEAVAFSPVDPSLMAVAADRHILLFDSESGARVGTLKGHGNTVRSLAFSPDGSILASGSGRVSFGIFAVDNSIRLWDVAERTQRIVLKGHEGPVNGIVFNRKGTVLASGSRDGTIRLWRTESGEPIATLTGHESPVQGLAYLPDDETFRPPDLRDINLTPGSKNSGKAHKFDGS